MSVDWAFILGVGAGALFASIGWYLATGPYRADDDNHDNY